MFFSKDLLTQRKQGLAIAWLAATVGPKANFAKKLNKKEVMDCSIEKVCFKICQPEEPLALRLSASLLLGVARLYGRQVAFFVTDVERVSDSLKRTVQDLTTKTSRTHVDMPHSARGAGKALLASIGEPTFEVDQFNTVDDYAWALFDDHFNRGITPYPDDSGIDTSQFLHQTLDNLSQEVAPGKARKQSTKSKRKNTLDESQLRLVDDEEHQLTFADLSQTAGGLFNESRDETMMQSDFDQGFDLNLDLDYGAEGEANAHKEDLQQNGFEFEAGGANFQDIGTPPDCLPQVVGTQEDVPPPGLALGEQEQTQKAQGFVACEAKSGDHQSRKLRGPQSKSQIIDGKLSLSREDMELDRRNYSSMMHALQRSAFMTREASKERRLAQSIIYGPPQQFYGFEVIETCRNRPHVSLEGTNILTQFTPTVWRNEVLPSRKRPESGAEKPPFKRPRQMPNAEIGRSTKAFSVNSPGATQEEPFAHDFAPGADGADFCFGDVELGRRASTPASGRDSQSFSLANSQLPWNNANFKAEAELGSFDAGRRSSVDASSAQLSFRSESPVPGRRRDSRNRLFPRSASPRRRRTDSRASSVHSYDKNFQIFPEWQSFSFEHNENSQVRLQQESSNFLAYAKTKADQSGRLYFDDLAPRADTSAAVAAQAFYHVLVLSSSSLIQVNGQDEPYGTISLRL